MKKLIIALALATASALSQAYSFAGDWTFDSSAVFNYNTNLGSGSQNSGGPSPVTVSQSTTNSFAFPFSISGISGQGDFVVAGNTVTDINSGQTTNPFSATLGIATVTIRLSYPTWNLTGTIDGTNPTIVDGFGDRAFHITGNPVTINNIRIEALLAGNWVDLGTNNNVVINSWSLQRDAVPEPATLTICGLVFLVLQKKKV
ncbi:MAG: hypothetical protein ACKVQS_06450 [Fimbriimonadaceae bacterium]